MPKQNTFTSNFTSGEVSPLIRGRVDAQRYQNGLETCENFIVRPQGPIIRRSGTSVRTPAKFHSSKHILVPFEFSDLQAYVMEFGVNYIRFHKNGEILLESTTEKSDDLMLHNNSGLLQIEADQLNDSPSFNIASIANNGSGKTRITTSRNHTLRTGAVMWFDDPSTVGADGEYAVTYVGPYQVDLLTLNYSASFTTGELRGHGCIEGDRVYLRANNDQIGLTGYHTVQHVELYDKLTLADFNADDTNDSHFSSNDQMWSIPIEVVTDYTEADLEDLKFCQSADVVYIMHPDYPTMKLTRLDNDGDHNDWLLAEVDFKDGPYLPWNSLAPNIDSTTPANGARHNDVYFELSSYAHTATVTSATGWAAGTPSADSSKYIEYREGDQWRLAQLPAGLTAAATTATVTIVDNVLLHLDETVKFRNTARVQIVGNIYKNVTYNAGSPNASPSVPDAGKQKRVDPNNFVTGSAGVLTSNYSNTFGTPDVGKYIRFFDTSSPRKPLWAQITKISSGAGTGASHGTALTMAANNATGNFVISNHSRTATLTAYRAGATFAAFASTDVGRHVRLAWGGRWTWGKITAYTSTSQVSVTLYEDVPRDPHNAANLAGALNGAETAASTTGRTYDWRMGAWSDTTGYPSHAVFHEQRLWFGRTDTEPQTFWGSITGDFENMRPTELDSTVLDDNAITFTIGSTKVNPIKWMISGPAMIIGTSGGEWQVKAGSSISEPISPSNIVCVPHTNHGSVATVNPIRIGSSLLFADRPAKRVWELYYDFQIDGLNDSDVSYLAEHLLRNGEGALYSAYQQEPSNVAWFVLNDGTLAAVTWDKKHDVMAWHHHTITDCTVESIACVPSSDSTHDDLYISVKRTVNGSTKRYIERLEKDFNPYDESDLTDRTDMKFLDAHVQIDGWTGATGAASFVVYGLLHLEAETVSVVVDGVLLSNTYTVSSGAIDLGAAYLVSPPDTILIGHRYTSTAKSLPPEGGSAFGVSQGKVKKILKMNVRLLNSIALKYGWNQNSASLNEMTNLNALSTNTAFFTGTKELIPNNPNDPESQWTLETSQPYPLNVLCVVLTVECGE